MSSDDPTKALEGIEKAPDALAGGFSLMVY